MVIKPDPKAFSTATGGHGWDYVLPSEDVGISYQEYDGVAPDHGWWVNDVCWEAYFIIEGTATVYINERTYTVGPRDLVIMLPGEKVRMMAKRLKLITITKPNWYQSQARIVEG